MKEVCSEQSHVKMGEIMSRNKNNDAHSRVNDKKMWNSLFGIKNNGKGICLDQTCRNEFLAFYKQHIFMPFLI